MKVLLLALSVLLVVQSAWCVTSEELLRSVHSQMLESYVQRERILSKTEVFCPGYRDEFDDALTESERCWTVADDTNETACSLIKSHTSKCFAPINNVMKECLPDKSKDVPQFVVDSIVGIADYMCKSDGEHFFELFNKCARTPTYRSERCVRRLVAKYQQQGTKPRSKDDVCEALRSLKGCLESHLTASCGNKITRDVFLDLYNVVLRKCDADSSAANEIETEERSDAKRHGIGPF